MHTTYISASIKNMFLCNICFIHVIRNCLMTSNWWQLQLVANQSDTSQKSLQAHFSCKSSLWLISMPTTHHPCQPNAPCSRAQYTSWKSWMSFSHPTGRKPLNSKHWNIILLLNLQYSRWTDRRSFISSFFLSRLSPKGSPCKSVTFSHATLRVGADSSTYFFFLIFIFWK